MNNCDVCPFLEKEDENSPNVLFRTDYWSVVLDENQEYLGKAFVTLRRHASSIPDLSDAEWSDLKLVMSEYEKAIKSAFSADVINWQCLMNNAVAAHQPTHVHWHAHPRYLGGATFAGEDFPDPKWPRRIEKTPKIVDKKTFSAIVTKIRENFDATS